MKLNFTLCGILLFLAVSTYAQRFERLDVPFMNRDDVWDFALSGGLSAPQFSNLDLNNDGLEDLYIFDRNGNVQLTFLSDGAKYIFSPAYISNFPDLNDWVLLRDYDQDGIMDIFAAATIPGVTGVEVHKGYFDNDILKFNLVEFSDRAFNILYAESGFTGQVYASKVDLPNVDDVDCDGDLDILSFGVNGGYVAYYKNLSVERGYGLDSLIFVLQDNCWGGFYESGLTPEIALSANSGDCVEELGGTIEPRHAGSTLLTLDLDGDSDKDFLVADISFNSMGALFNGGSCTMAWMNEQDVNFPSYDTPSAVALFSAPYYADMDLDGVKDLIIAPNDVNNSNGSEAVWFYKNTGTNELPVFSLQNKRALLDEMIDLGAGANPTFVDYNADGLLDIVVGNIGYDLPSGDNDGRLALFENTGTADTPAFQLVDNDYLRFSQFNGQAYDYAPAFGDMDDDGDMDLVVGSDNGITFYAENIAGEGEVFEFGNIIPNWLDVDPGQHTTPTIIDFNGDGANDLIIGERNGNINYYENIGSTRQAAFNTDLSTPPNSGFVGRIDTREAGYVTGYSSPAIVKIGEELKLITGTENGKLELYNMNTSDITTASVLEFSNFGEIKEGRFTRPAIADINNDGKLDILVVTYVVD